jgi:hypothetical protein
VIEQSVLDPRGRLLLRTLKAAGVGRPTSQDDPDDGRYLERRRVTGPTLDCPVMVSPLTWSWENVAVASDSFKISPVMVPETGPEKSGRPPTETLPVTLVPLWLSVAETGAVVPPVPTLPDHVPATFAVGALKALCCSCLAVPHPRAVMVKSARSTTVVALIVMSSVGRVAFSTFPPWLSRAQ